MFIHKKRYFDLNSGTLYCPNNIYNVIFEALTVIILKIKSSGMLHRVN